MTATTIALATSMVVAATGPAFAYIDPVSGSTLLQLAVATAVGALVTLKIYWNRFTLWVRNLFSRGRDKKAAEEIGE